MSKFFFNVLLNIFQIRIKFLWSTTYVDLLVLCVAVYFFHGQFASEISFKEARSDAICHLFKKLERLFGSVEILKK